MLSIDDIMAFGDKNTACKLPGSLQFPSARHFDRITHVLLAQMSPGSGGSP